MNNEKIDDKSVGAQENEYRSYSVDETGRRLSVTGRRVSIVDDVFGETVEGGPNYCNVGWLRTAILMMKTQIGLGVLSIRALFDVFGMVPGGICLIVIAMITTWSDCIVGVFKLRHRSVYSLDDVSQLLFGCIGRELFGVTSVLYWIFLAGAGMLGISIGLNAVSTHGVCTAVFVAVAAIIGFGLFRIQTFSKISWPAWVGVICILTAIFTVTIAVGVQDRSADAPASGFFVSHYKVTNNPSFTDAISACSSLVFAYSGMLTLFSTVSDMRYPRLYTRSLIICQSVVTATYITIGVVVYYYAGSYVASPALGSAGALLKKVAYGFALPGLIVTTTLVIHLPAKLHDWDATVTYVIASAIPVFGGLVSLMGALLGTLMSFLPMGCM
ncbi:uncharacterized protein Z519_08356 [Cladophialophora bantiana CBS 173.52]|uniref:Amino acid transporter transmembrane domain-containing protein n=1 Tax=Cladophialophora bantiana (strain ATCC 10958 / CBS 173.52 / CDC B-1940 / NIH 8579) TaxID=1442370 RepID=A0A0D2HL46_CLAB1|nr:uncharacterized protein Z519_08356 [Cladophialophora bantiana CBS 173.52]KIW91460.1 hypothetical protein Z519_08356 [Cladophialophora bantiana CBS 173.52]